jgi:hypothetical protein
MRGLGILLLPYLEQPVPSHHCLSFWRADLRKDFLLSNASFAFNLFAFDWFVTWF